MVFETERLFIRKSTASDRDVEFFFRLWTNSEVMINVGFPNGLKITREDVRRQLSSQDDSEYNVRLVAMLKGTGEMIGECMMRLPDEQGISETDVKLFPQYWGNKYGIEIKQGLVDHLFTHTDCMAVKATPNKNNIASQKMQESVRGKRVGEGVFKFPEKMQDYTVDVPYYEYRVMREDWEKGDR